MACTGEIPALISGREIHVATDFHQRPVYFFLLILYLFLHHGHELPDAINLFCQVKEGFLSNSRVFVRQEVPVGYQPDHLMVRRHSSSQGMFLDRNTPPIFSNYFPL